VIPRDNVKIPKRDIIISAIIGCFVAILIIPILKHTEINLPFVLTLAAPLVLPIIYILSMFFALIFGHKQKLIYQIIKFIQVGSLNTFVDWGILNLFLILATVNSGFLYAVCKAGSFIVAATNSYFWNKYWTFKKETEPSTFSEKKRRGGELFCFSIVSLVGFALNVATAHFIVNHWGPQFHIDVKSWATVGALGGTLVGLVWNFLGYRSTVFSGMERQGEKVLSWKVTFAKAFKYAAVFFVFALFAVSSYFVFVKLWGKELLLRDGYPYNSAIYERRMNPKVPKTDQPLIFFSKNYFFLDSKENSQNESWDSRFTEEEILIQIKEEYARHANREPLLGEGFRWVTRRLFHNFGLVTKDIQRSGQPRPFFLWLHYELFPFKTVINLAWEPEKSPDQISEKRFCEERNIDYYNFSWSAGGPQNWGEVDKVIEIIDHCEKPVWIHCKGGKDRTGGLIALWKRKKNYPLAMIFQDFEKHRKPASPWIRKLLF
jgi:putative flippase GtrA